MAPLDGPKRDGAAPGEPGALAKLADDVLRKPARERLELLLHAPQPMRLVRALPDGELYLTVREVGPHDALPLMALASAAQIQHLMDLEGWRGDRFDAERAGAWAAFILEAGEPVLLRFLRAMDDELLALLFAKWMRVAQIEIDGTPSPDGHGETEAGTDEGFLAPDGWHRFAPAIPAHAPAVRRIAEVLIQSDPDRYDRIMLDAQWETPSVLEELAFHWRNSRLEEHGFPPRDEAFDVFAPPTGVRSGTAVPAPARDGDLAAPRAILRVDTGPGFLAAALDRLDPENRERILFETTSVANRILVADQADPGDPAAHRRSAQTAAGFLEIALTLRGTSDPQDASTVLREVPIIELFREGFATAAGLRERARGFVRSAWPASHPRALEILDPPLRGCVSALLLRRPAFFDAAARTEETALREFRSVDDVERTRAGLDLANLVGRAVFEAVGWSMDEVLRAVSREGALPVASALLATALARHAADGRLAGGPVATQARDALVGRLAREGSALIDRFGSRMSDALGADERQRKLLAVYLRSVVVPFVRTDADEKEAATLRDRILVSDSA